MVRASSLELGCRDLDSHLGLRIFSVLSGDQIEKMAQDFRFSCYSPIMSQKWKEAYDDELLFFLPYFPTQPSLSNDLLVSFFWNEKL